jgi:hypothetical protein
MNTDDFVIDLKEFNYDRHVLRDIFDRVRPHGRIKALKWKLPGRLVPVDQSVNLVIQHGENMMVDPTKAHLSHDLLQHDYIRDMVKRLNFDHEITSGNVDIIWNRKGFVFEPHVDHYAKATMIWTILPIEQGAKINFYSKEKIQYELGQALGFGDILKKEDILHTHVYGVDYPAIFNSHWPHGVSLVNDVERVCLRLRIDEPFESIVNKYRTGNLIKS